MATEGLTSIAAPSLIDLSKKVRIQSPVIITSSLMKSPTTGKWWSEERQSEIRSCFLSDWDRPGSQCVALFSLNTWHPGGIINIKKKRKIACKCWTLKSFLSSATRASLNSHTWNIYIPLRSCSKGFPFPQLYYCTSRLDSVFLSVCSSL